jgi:putative endopeptidase
MRSHRPDAFLPFTAIALVCLAFISFGCAVTETVEETAAPTDRLDSNEVAATVVAAMDTTVDPCQDFYRYACGGWIDSTERPVDESRWVRSFSVINEENRHVVRSILEEAGAEPGEDPNRQRIGYYYGSCMDEASVEERGAEPLEALLARVASVEDAESLLGVVGELHRRGIAAGFAGAVFPDFQDPDLNIAWFFQGGLGMPDRDYYLSDDPKKQEQLAAYVEFMTTMFGLLGDDDETAAANAGVVLGFETELAKVSRPRQDMRDWERLYNKLDVSGLAELTPNLPWSAYFSAIGYPNVVDLSVATPEFFERLEGLVAESDPTTLQIYLRWHVVRNLADYLSNDFVMADFDFYGKTMRGQEEIQPRWKRCVRDTGRALGEAIGVEYVARKFAGSSKDVALEMIGDLEKAFEASLPALAWMDDTTRGRALEKVATLDNKIGYPDKWRDYSTMNLVPDDYFTNAMAGIQFEFDREAKKIGNPVDRSEWGMPPQMVNAYYNPQWNEIAFPAGILQPPFFHRDHPAAMNYGGIGGVIGHELTHGFDDQGRKFSPTGKLEEWWEPKVEERFVEQAQCVEDYYSKFEVAPGVNVNGKLTLGENIADIGGVKQAYKAYKLWETRNPDAGLFVDGLTNDQLFFVAWAQDWCTLVTEEAERQQVTIDPHSPSKFRVLGPMAQNAAFAEAFQCEVGTPMNPEDRCQVW